MHEKNGGGDYKLKQQKNFAFLTHACVSCEAAPNCNCL